MKGIMFKEPLFNKILIGEKTQTRRRINENPEECIIQLEEGKYNVYGYSMEHIKEVKPRYRQGEVIYLKEPFKEVEPFKFLYKFDMEEEDRKAHKWKSKMFMPCRAARYFIHIDKVEVQPLHDLNQESAIAEGIDKKETFAVLKFAQLWNRIEKRPFNYENNPYVFVYYFSMIKKIGYSTNKEIGTKLYTTFQKGREVYDWDNKKRKLVLSDLPF